MKTTRWLPVRYYRFFVRVFLLAICGYLIMPSPALAYQFFYLQSGSSYTAAKWQVLPVNFVVDNGPTDILAELQTAATTWNNVATARDVLGTMTRAANDFTGVNFGTAWGKLTGDGQQEVILDEDGSALMAVGIDPASINGYGPTKKEIQGGQAVIIDAFLLLNGTRTNFDRRSTEVHELGHIQGLAHSSVGMHNSASPPSDALDPININAVPTMHPFSTGNGTARRTLEADDIAGISELYPESSFTATFGAIDGTVTRCFSTEAVIGANVRAVNTANPNIQVSRFTGYDGNDQGRFVLNGLPPGSYKLVVEPMGANDFNIANRFGTPPTRQDQDFQTEYYNPPDEDNCSEETPDMPVNVSVSASATISNKNFKVGGTDLSFVVDDTGSMSQEIGAVRTVLSGFISTLNVLHQTLGTPFPSVAIVTFKDDVTKRLVSKDPARLQSVVNGLVASGGGDCPESANAALLTAGRLLRRGGVAMLFTDADSRADGPNRVAVTSLYRARGARVFTLLSGTCSGPITSPAILDPAAPANEPMNPGNSRNLDEFPLPPVLGVEGSVRTFSEISIDTGGFFTALPGIKTGNPVETQRYINTGTNLAVSSAVPAVGLVTPGDGAQAGTFNIEIAGSNTDFQTSSMVSFSGTGISVNSITALSPVRIIANISVAASAALGFRDVTVSTNLGGSIEMATGGGAFQVVGPPVGPTILGAIPAQGAQGQTLDVALSAINTHFVNGTSVGNLGSGITVNATRVLSSTAAIVNISIANDAAIGFRDVRVNTGSEIATEDVVGPFLVIAPPAAIPRISAVFPSDAFRGQTLDVAITAQNSTFVAGTSIAGFSGAGITVNRTTVTSPTTAIANITIAAAAPLGFRDVFITTGSEIAALLSGFQVKGEAFDTVIQDDVSGSILKLNRTTGAYQFLDCRKGTVFNGRGGLTIKFCKLELLDTGPDPKRPDRRVSALVNFCTRVGTASVAVSKTGQPITLSDNDMANSLASCR